ncbi:MAG: hypothetical protein D6704_10365 [Nitrospirae bacterium]|nr:MAG: hypothetical protein D6704_10365 [Nitrospirota bacterium]
MAEGEESGDEGAEEGEGAHGPFEHGAHLCVHPVEAGVELAGHAVEAFVDAIEALIDAVEAGVKLAGHMIEAFTDFSAKLAEVGS